MNWLRKFLSSVWALLKVQPKPSPAPAPPVEEYVYRAGHFVEREVDIRGGSVEFEAWVPEAGRIEDWGTAEIIALYDAESYHSKSGNLYSLHPYKTKACTGKVCREPRYNLPWDRWRKIRCEWTPTTWAVAIDGVPVRCGLATPWGPRVRAIYGHCPPGHLLAGAKLRGIKWSDGP